MWQHRRSCFSTPREPVFTPRLFSLHTHNLTGPGHAVREARMENFSRGSNFAHKNPRAVMAGYLEFVTSEPLALCASELGRIVNTKSSPATKLTRRNGLRGQRG